MGGPAATTVGEEQKQEQGLALVQHLPVVAWPVLEALPKTPTATPNAVLSTVVGAHGLPMVPAAEPVEEAPRQEPGLAPVHHLHVGAQPVLEDLPKMPTATASVVRLLVVGALGLSGGLAKASLLRNLTLAAMEIRFIKAKK